MIRDGCPKLFYDYLGNSSGIMHISWTKARHCPADMQRIPWALNANWLR